MYPDVQCPGLGDSRGKAGPAIEEGGTAVCVLSMVCGSG